MVSRKPDYSSAKDKDKKQHGDGDTGRKPPKVVLSELKDAFTGGAWTIEPGGEVIIERPFGGKRQKSICLVKKVSPDLVEVWDETLNRWFAFNPAELEAGGVVAKALR